MTLPDSLDLRVVRTGAGRDLPWDEPVPGDLSPAAQERLGRAWAHRFRMEHLAVGAFSLLSQEAAAVGASPVVLSLLTRAANDEVRHADLCRRYAVRWLGEAAVEERLKGTPPVPPHRDRTPEERALLHVVEMCCVNETLTGAYFTELLARTTTPLARALLLSLLEDEIDHGRVGWAYLTERIEEPWARPAIERELLPMLVRSLGPVFAARDAASEPEPAIERHGYLGPRASAEHTREVLENLVLRGLRELRVDTRATENELSARGWIRPPA